MIEAVIYKCDWPGCGARGRTRGDEDLGAGWRECAEDSLHLCPGHADRSFVELDAALFEAHAER